MKTGLCTTTGFQANQITRKEHKTNASPCHGATTQIFTIPSESVNGRAFTAEPIQLLAIMAIRIRGFALTSKVARIQEASILLG